MSQDASVGNMLVIRVCALALGIWLALAATAQAQGGLGTLGKSGGFTYVTGSLDVPPQGEDAATLPCPGNLRPISGGAELTGGPEAQYLSAQTTLLGDGWQTRAWDGTGNSSLATIFAICRKDVNDALSISSNDRGVQAGPGTESLKVKCDSGDIIGGGGYFAGDNFDSWYLNSSYPDGKGWVWTGYHVDGTSESELTAEAHCESGGSSDVRTKSVSTDKELVKAKVFCKTGVATGGGASASKDASNAHLVKTIPIDSKDKGKVPDDGWSIVYENDGIVKQKFTAYVVCR
jgi:hypothetical protein